MKHSHCSFCGHSSNKKDHMNFSCEYCVTKDDEGCQRKPEGFKCHCFSCVLNKRHKEQKREENWYFKNWHKIAEEPNFPKDEIIDMYLCNDNCYFLDMSTPMRETLLFGQYEFDSVERVKMRYGYQFYVVKRRRAGGNITTSKFHQMNPVCNKM
uniref:Uncharacterized protein n=1 Tax=Phaseolus vulgaris TaxID=3885 RepID=V7BDG5_PHAVU|nr:hypothetical protein PHAVU_007G109300g [Phaseolus vulgaris]ESW15869.1 hypothetical protein PHAVU_007G109300g [Phaseolus vulgaris]